MTDDELMGRVRDGEPGVLAEVFERHHARLYAFLSRLTGSRLAAEDLVQEVFVRMLAYRASYRSGGSFAVWMYRIARNVHKDHRSRVDEFFIDDIVEPASDEPSPLDHAARMQESALLAEALAQLSDEQREVLILVRFEGLRFAEIGELLGCSEGAAKVRAHRALARLREIYFALVETKP